MVGILDVIPIVGDIIDKAIPDPQIKADLQVKLATLADQEAARAHDEEMGQMATNTAEATNQNLFVAGWRPFIGWVGGAGLAYSFVICPIASWGATVLFHYHGTFPALDTGQLMDLIMGMLGFGTLRTYEKVKGIPDSQPLGQPNTPIVLPAQPVKKGLGSKVFGSAWPF